jgi:hypothetical protein
MIYFVWKWATQEVKPILGEASTVLIALIDRIRMLDNDLIRLNQKVNITLMIRDEKLYDALNPDTKNNKTHSLPKEHPKEVAKEALKEAIKDVPKALPKKPLKDVTSETPDEVANRQEASGGNG